MKIDLFQDILPSIQKHVCAKFVYRLRADFRESINYISCELGGKFPVLRNYSIKNAGDLYLDNQISNSHLSYKFIKRKFCICDDLSVNETLAKITRDETN